MHGRNIRALERSENNIAVCSPPWLISPVWIQAPLSNPPFVNCVQPVFQRGEIVLVACQRDPRGRSAWRALRGASWSSWTTSSSRPRRRSSMKRTMAMTPRSSSTMAMGTVEMATMIWCHHHHHRFLRHQGLGEMDRGHHRGLRLQVDHNMEVHKVKVLNVVDPERDWPWRRPSLDLQAVTRHRRLRRRRHLHRGSRGETCHRHQLSMATERRTRSASRSMPTRWTATWP